jgi:hypothetical protein
MAQYQHTEEATSKKWRRKAISPADVPRLRVCYDQLQSAEARVQALYARWAELEDKLQ